MNAHEHEDLARVSSLTGSTGRDYTAAEDEELTAAFEAMHEASEQTVRGDSGLLRQLCCHSDDITLAGRGGAYERGWPAVSERYDWVAAQYADGHLEHELLASGRSGDLAYTFELTTGHVTFVGADHAVPIAVRETHIWRHEADGWRLLHRHADQLMDKVERLSDLHQS